ncbi:MAG: hypothetical protein LQ347_003551, partial [Umbilicaria vellea]
DNGTGHDPSYNGNSSACRDQPEDDQYHSHALMLARGSTVDESRSAPWYGHLDPDLDPYRRASSWDGSNRDEASRQYIVLGLPHRRSLRFGHNSGQSAPPYEVPSGSAQLQNPGSSNNMFSSHMVATSGNAPRPMVERGFLDETSEPPPYEVATRSQAMAQYVQDWSANWDRMEPGRSNARGDARGE